MSSERMNHLGERLARLASKPLELLDNLGELSAVVADLSMMSMMPVNIPELRQSVFHDPGLGVQIAAVLALRLGGNVSVSQDDLDGLHDYTAQESFNGATGVFNLTITKKP